MFWNMYRIEQTKLFKRKVLWVEMILMVLMVATTAVSVFFVTQMAEVPVEIAGELSKALIWPDALTFMLGLMAGNQIGGLLMIVLVGAVVAQEYTWNSMSLWLSHSTPRSAVMISKAVVIGLASLMIVLATFVVNALVTLIFTLFLTGGLDLSQVNFVEVFLSVLGAAFTMLPYSMLTFLLAVLSRSAYVAIGGGVAFALIFESIGGQLLRLFGGLGARIADFLPGSLARSLTPGVITVSSASTAPAVLDPALAAVVIAVYSAIFFGLALWIFRRQDLTT